LPGGCSIGTRPVDLHIKAFEQMGAKITLSKGYIEAKAPKDGLYGAEIKFPIISVGATENTIMAASLAKGTTTIVNAAKEPEIVDLSNCLNSMGAKIKGAGTNIITIEGVKTLHGCSHKVISDRIEAGSFAIAAAITGGELELTDCNPNHLTSLSKYLINSGVNWENNENSIKVSSNGDLNPISIKTEEYPGFPTDLQAQFMTLMCIANGESEISETIFENRFMHVPELTRMGANISVDAGKAKVIGVDQLHGARLMATDLRASISLVIAALSAQGESIISRIYHLDRGYEKLEKKLIKCGANIKRIED
jgi:UDP-N-acetylglucosamine 1-carboxyvinyltransferase